MTTDLLYRAADQVDAAREATTDTEVSDRLQTLANQLRSQAGRDATPALGTLDRIHAKLREIEAQTDETASRAAIERARDDILAFLQTLDDRGMKQHGSSQNPDANGSV
jgi:ectoine hydroxylase-related dioxygenase (phytanoyl-CoA dioxygenase family)